jgi:histidinol phosphatase-like PHP family hydrolase
MENLKKKILLDVHTHTVASGHAYSSLQEMARAAADKGLEVLEPDDLRQRISRLVEEMRGLYVTDSEGK